MSAVWWFVLFEVGGYKCGAGEFWENTCGCFGQPKVNEIFKVNWSGSTRLAFD